MPSPADKILDFAKLLTPIPGEKSTGVDPRDDKTHQSLYRQIRSSRETARAAERLNDKNNAPPDWKPVLNDSIKLLAEQAKDLEITAFLIESLIRLHGIAGLRDGFQLARELAERFWDGLYPTPDEDGLATRVKGLAGLNGEDSDGVLIPPLSRVPITDSADGERFTRADYNEALSLKKITDKPKLDKKIADGALTEEKFLKAAAGTEATFYNRLVKDIEACLAEFEKLGASLDKRCNGRGPPTSTIRTALAELLRTVKQVAGDKWKDPAAPTAPPPEKKPQANVNGVAPELGPAPVAAGVIQSREQALEILQKVADFFRRTESHPFVAYQVEQAVRWAKLPVPDLLTELIPDEASRKNVFKQVGIVAKSAQPAPK
jgi:type VI secretion system protein ImpA